jgi:hypothetical protein
VPVIANDVTVDLVSVQPDGTRYSLGDWVSELTWAEMPTELPVRMHAVLPNVQIGTPFGGYISDLLSNGSKLELVAAWGPGLEDAKVIHRFNVFHWIYTNEGQPMVDITAYDDLIYLAKSQSTYLFYEWTPANQIIQTILTDWQVPQGKIDQPVTPIQQTYFRAMPIAQIINQVLIWAFMRAPADQKEPWFLQMRDGAVSVITPGTNDVVYVLDSELNLASWQDDQSIEDLVTEVRIISQMMYQSTNPGDAPFRLPLGMVIPDQNVNYEQIAQSQQTQNKQYYQKHDDGYCWLDTLDPSGNLVASERADDTMCSVDGPIPASAVGNTIIDPGTGNPLSPVGGDAQLAQEAVEVTRNAEFQAAQKIAHIRNEITTTTGDDPYLVTQQALDILSIKGIPWKVRTAVGPLMPHCRRGDAFMVFADTMDPAANVIIATGLQHDAVARKTQFIFDSSGILGRRIRRQHYLGAIAGVEGDLREQDQSEAAQRAKEGKPPLIWPPTGDPGNLIMTAARKWMGVPYVFGGSSRTGLDCSAFTQNVMSSLGVQIPRTAQLQYNASQKVDASQVRVGDLVFFEHTYESPDTVTHVGFISRIEQSTTKQYPGQHFWMVDASSSAGQVREEPITPWWQQHLTGFGRFDVPISAGVTSVGTPAQTP